MHSHKTLAGFGNAKDTVIVFFPSLKGNISVCLDSAALGVVVLAQRLSQLKEGFAQRWSFLYTPGNYSYSHEKNLALCRVVKGEREVTPWAIFCYPPIQNLPFKSEMCQL